MPKIVCFGDSITAGTGLPDRQTYPAQLQKMLQKDGYKYLVVNAGISRDTTFEGLRRIDSCVKNAFSILIVELGINDILRGRPANLVNQNLTEIIRKAQAKGGTVVLVSIDAPANTGPDYRRQMTQVNRDLAAQTRILLIPFSFQIPARTMRADGIHPNARGARILAQTVYGAIKPLLQQ